MQVEVISSLPLLVYSRIVEFAHSRGLSGREAVVLILGAGIGLNRKEAAYRIGCRPGTVDTYWNRILRKCGADSQLEVFASLLAFALENAREACVTGPSRPDRTSSAVRDMVRYRAGIDAAIHGTPAMTAGTPLGEWGGSHPPDPS